MFDLTYYHSSQIYYMLFYMLFFKDRINYKNKLMFFYFLLINFETKRNAT